MSSEALGTERIMVVDDEPISLRLLDRMLRGQGYQDLILIDDPRDVLDLYRAARPHLILLDINMPHLDGYQVMAELKALSDPLLPPIVIMTAQHSQDYLIKALTAGARDFITKPFDCTELLMRVRNLLDAQLAYRLMHDQKRLLEDMVRERTEELRHTQLQVVQRLGMAAEYRDEETGFHILRMSHMTAHLARTIGWNDADSDLILNASPMHDIGKIGIPDAILLKPGKLDAAEWAIMKTHPNIGAGMLDGGDSDLMIMAREIALTHHEKWDGSGYPNGLAGEAIALSGRLAALADVFDALTTRRPYKNAWTIEAAVQWIRENSGKHFDPKLVEVFVRELPHILEIRDRYADPDGGAMNS